MKTELFQQKALDNATGPEHLSAQIRLVRPGLVTAIGFFGLMLVIFLIWSVLTTVPITVPGKGIILDSGGVSAISSAGGGQVLSVDVRLGEQVQKGQVIARLSQPDLAGALELQKQTLAGLKAQKQQIVDFNAQRTKTQKAFNQSRGIRLQQTLKEKNRLLEAYRKQLKAEQQLFSTGGISRTAVVQTQAQITGSEAEIANLQSEIDSLDEKLTLDAIEDGKRLLDVNLQIAKAEQALTQKQAEFDRRGKIISPFAGKISEIRISQGDILRPDTVAMSILPHHDKSDTSLKGYLFVPADKGSEVKQSMQVKVYPTTVKRQEFGYIPATVSRVSSLPVSQQEMLRYTRNEKLVQDLLKGGVAFQIELTLPRSDTASGFAWSSSGGPPFAIGHGTEFDAGVAVRRVRLISLVIPFTERFFTPKTH